MTILQRYSGIITGTCPIWELEASGQQRRQIVSPKVESSDMIFLLALRSYSRAYTKRYGKMSAVHSRFPLWQPDLTKNRTSHTCNVFVFGT
jgi:hypothetical protein